MTLLTACASETLPVSTSDILRARPSARPQVIDGIKKCPECTTENDQPMIKMSERDFVQIKLKLSELDDYVTYLMDFL